jgi:hypothetical protein
MFGKLLVTEAAAAAVCEATVQQQQHCQGQVLDC